MIHRSFALPLALLLAAGCTPVPSPTPPPAPSAAATTTVAPPATAPSASATAEVSPPAPSSPFHVIAESPEPFELQTVGNSTYAVGPGVVAQVTGKGLVSLGKGREDLPVWGVPAFFAGRGDRTFLSFLTDNGRVGYSVLYERTGDSWKETKTLPLGTIYAGIGPWKNGSLLAATLGVGMQISFQKPGISVVAGARGGEPRLPKGAKGCPAALFPSAMLSFESGEVLALGPECLPPSADVSWPAPGDKVVLASWTAGSQEAAVTEVDAGGIAGDTLGRAVGRAPNDVWVSSAGGYTKPFFLHFDGKAFTKDSGAPGEDATSLAVAADGTLYAVFAGALHRRSPAGAWEALLLPDRHRATSVAVAGTDVWVASEIGRGPSGKEPAALLHLGPAPAEVQKVPPPAKPAPTYKQLRPVTASCKSLFVMMYAFTKVTPPDYDFPLTRKALKGRLKYSKARFVVTEDGGRKFFGAFVPDIATGRDLTALIEKEVSGAKPAFVCSDPTVVSELKLDLTTGERVK